jgi:hypothetical protein
MEVACSRSNEVRAEKRDRSPQLPTPSHPRCALTVFLLQCLPHNLAFMDECFRRSQKSVAKLHQSYRCWTLSSVCLYTHGHLALRIHVKNTCVDSQSRIAARKSTNSTDRMLLYQTSSRAAQRGRIIYIA